MTTLRERIRAKQRQRIRRAKKAAACAALAAVAIITAGLSTGAEQQAPLVEISYTVQPGDTWWDVAEKYHGLDARGEYFLQYKHEQEQLNKGIDTGALKPGQVLRIQYQPRGGEADGDD